MWPVDREDHQGLEMNKSEPLYISRSCLRKLRAWSLSKKEIGVICGGKGRTITHVVRLRNIDRSWKDTFDWNPREYREAVATLKKQKLEILAGAHSHPGPKDRAFPSHGDCKLIPRGNLEIIIATGRGEIRVWRMARTRKQTLQQEIQLIEVSPKA